MSKERRGLNAESLGKTCVPFCMHDLLSSHDTSLCLYNIHFPPLPNKISLMMILHSTGDSSSNEVVLVYIVIVPLLLILSLSTSTAILAIYVLKVKKRKSNHSENTLANAEIGSVN